MCRDNSLIVSLILPDVEQSRHYLFECIDMQRLTTISTHFFGIFSSRRPVSSFSAKEEGRYFSELWLNSAVDSVLRIVPVSCLLFLNYNRNYAKFDEMPATQYIRFRLRFIAKKSHSSRQFYK